MTVLYSDTDLTAPGGYTECDNFAGIILDSSNCIPSYHVICSEVSLSCLMMPLTPHSIPESGLESDDVDVLSEQRSDNVSSSEHERGDDQERGRTLNRTWFLLMV